MKVVSKIFLLLFISLKINAQVVVNKDARLDALSAKQAIINKRSAMVTSTGSFKGFRLQVISTNDRDKAFKIKADLLAKFPEHKTYAMFQSPYFKIRIGNFIKKTDAENFRKQLSLFYPSGVYVVEDGIEYVPSENEVGN